MTAPAPFAPSVRYNSAVDVHAQISGYCKRASACSNCYLPCPAFSLGALGDCVPNWGRLCSTLPKSGFQARSSVWASGAVRLSNMWSVPLLTISQTAWVITRAQGPTYKVSLPMLRRPPSSHGTLYSPFRIQIRFRSKITGNLGLHQKLILLLD